MKVEIILFLCIMLLFSCQKKTESTSPLSENITETVYASAIVKAENQYEVFATVNGILNEIFVSENDLIKAGTPLMQVVDESITLNRENARLAAGYADVSANKEKIAEAENSVALAQSKFINDSLLYRRQ